MQAQALFGLKLPALPFGGAPKSNGADLKQRREQAKEEVRAAAKAPAMRSASMAIRRAQSSWGSLAKLHDEPHEPQQPQKQ